jgi:hypothetical protein
VAQVSAAILLMLRSGRDSLTYGPLALEYETAINGRADAIATSNVRDFGQAPSAWMCGPREKQENQTIKETKTYPLRLPRSLKDAVERLSREDGTSINQFVATAVAEKVSALETARFFAERKARADFKAFDKIMKRRRGRVPPRAGDELAR